jgi:hypothetical protein
MVLPHQELDPLLSSSLLPIVRFAKAKEIELELCTLLEAGQTLPMIKKMQRIVTVFYDCIRRPEFLLAATLETERMVVVMLVAVASKEKITFVCYCYCFCCLPNGLVHY